MIEKLGDTNRDGTIYKMLLPDEVPMCADYRHKQTAVEPIPVDVKFESDYYNIQDNRIKVFERDDCLCHYCRKQLTRFFCYTRSRSAGLEGGDNTFGNLVTSCLRCNLRCGNRPVMDAITWGGRDS